MQNKHLFGLTSTTIQQILDVFSANPDVEEVILYGSRAMGNFRPGSDIDFALKGDDLTLQHINNIGLALDDLLLPYEFDLANYAHIDNDALLEHIKRVGHTFYKK